MIESATRLITTCARVIADGVWVLVTVSNVFGLVVTNTYDSNGLLVSSTDAIGTVTTNQYDSFGNLERVRSGYYSGGSFIMLTSSGHLYDANNNRLISTNAVNVETRYQYDAQGRVITVTNAFGTGDQAITRTTYDLAGRVVQTIDARNVTNAFGYDALSRRTSVTNAFGTSIPQVTKYAYNAEGNLTNVVDNLGRATDFEYDALNRQAKTIFPPTVVAGHRVKKEAAATTLYLFDEQNPAGYAQVLEELTVSSGTTNISRLYLYGLDLISQRQSGGTVHYYGYDGLGSVRFLMASNGSVSDTYTYDAYGTLIASTGTTPNSYRYTGEQWDSDLSLEYLRARYMNPEVGRFWSMDSFDGYHHDPSSLHKYTYAANDPANRIDPSGHEYTASGQVGVLGNLGTITRFTTSVLRTAYKAKKGLEFVADLRGMAAYLLSGEFSALMRSQLQQSVDTVKSVDIDAAVESLLRHTDTLIIQSGAAWGPFLVGNASKVERFVIYMPTVPGIRYFEVGIPTPSRMKYDLALGFGAGVDEKASASKKAGRLTGVGIGLKGRRESRQIWRMDYHPAHDIRGTGDRAYFSDPPFHYHILRP